MRELIVDGKPVHVPERPVSLLSALRDNGITTAKRACDMGECGACTVLVDGRAVMACVTLVDLVDGEVTTAAGLGESGDELRSAFADHAAFQCGFCTPGQIVRAESLLRRSTGLGRTDITYEMAGNVCRCTGYVQIVDAVCAVADARAAREQEGR